MKIEKSEDRIGREDQIFCNQCKGVTAHTIRGAHDSHWDLGGESGMAGGGKHDMLSCDGCGCVTHRDKLWSTEDQPTTNLYPPRPDPESRQPNYYLELPWGSPLESVYRQTISAFNGQLPTLTGAGVRLLIEGICSDRGVKDGAVFDETGKPIVSKESGKPVRRDNLEGKINGLVEQGLIAKNQAKTLHEIRFLGNDAAHELDQPSRESLKTAIDICEQILAQIYQQPEAAERLAARKRPKKKT